MIINSLLDNDFYKFTMQQAVLHQFPDVQVEAKFKCRGPEVLFFIKNDLEREIEHLCSLRFTEDELEYLEKIPFLKKDYIDFLRIFQLPRKAIFIDKDENGQLNIIIKGSWLHIILFEVPILAIVNELYCLGDSDSYAQHCGFLKLTNKINLVKFNNPSNFKFADFGTRRRFSSSWQNIVVETLKRNLPNNFIGTSNVLLAKKYDIKYIGTMAHEWVMAGQGLSNVRLVNSQKYMLETWVKEYRGDLGIALSDTLGFEAFLNDFDKFLAKLYDGCRHDSGNPYTWCLSLIKHYKKLGIDPRTKTAVFSDGLTFEKALQLYETFKDQIQTSFGIGTNLTNDVGLTPLQIVIKLVYVNGSPVAKLSDSPGKGMCENESFLNYLKYVYQIID